MSDWNWKLACQILIIVFTVLNFAKSFREIDEKHRGSSGTNFMAALIIYSVVALVLYSAGAFSLIGGPK